MIYEHYMNGKILYKIESGRGVKSGYLVRIQDSEFIENFHLIPE